MSNLVYVVDDDDAVRDSLQTMLAAEGYVVRCFESAARFLSDGDLNGGCLIADIAMPGMTGLELQEELNRRHATIPVIIITGHGDIPIAVRAMRAGALDFIEKPFEDTHILESIGRALLVGQQARDKAKDGKAACDQLKLLTAREREVLDQLVQGHPNKIVAHHLGISPRTVEIHRANLMDKLNARSLSDLVRLVLAATPD